MGKQENGQEDNVILFPGLIAKLVEKGMTSLKEKKYYDALRYFQESTELEESHPQARYGLVITNIELNRLEEARKHCESMLNEGIGQYYDILQVYVSLLVQLGDYQEVVHLLETVIAEEKLPPNMAESFYQLLDFSRQMTSDSVEIVEDYEEDSIDGMTNTEELIQNLEGGDPDQQWGAIQRLSQINSPKVQEAYRSFLKGKENNPVLKSYLIQILKELHSKETFEVHKFGETFEVNIGQLEDIFHEKFGANVLDRLDKSLSQKSPSLYEMVQQVWWHYLFALYPKSPKPLHTETWACALHILGSALIEGEETTEEIVDQYEVDEKEVESAVNHMKVIESLILTLNDSHT
ncbi:tetratricopeptide repeat protein [Bacillus shivajii]|uniref:DUF3196 family protein n=1 Tax=Bacillus shivajii TaxID=1983719 RepID=UPI001CFC43DF|nr:tetratricopeptide repeat protein [Bacillus shivajii]UCZ52139.1 tetratricopeptide repeat protein [Bacillus shivajii]